MTDNREFLADIQEQLISLLVSNSPIADSGLANVIQAKDHPRVALAAQMMAGKRVAKCKTVLPATFSIGKFQPSTLIEFTTTSPYRSADFFTNSLQFFIFLTRLNRRGRLTCKGLVDLCYAELAIAANTRLPVRRRLSESGADDSALHGLWCLARGTHIREFSVDVFEVIEGICKAGTLRSRPCYGLFSKPLGRTLGAAYEVNRMTYNLLLSMRGSGSAIPSSLLSTSSGLEFARWLISCGAIVTKV
jgi:hypothetical protein